MDRNKKIIRVSIVGILANVLLAAFKALVGLLSGAIAILMDAVNNLSDALSSVITIVGTKLSARPADQKHPFGHGRVEYLSAIVISLIVIAAGVTSLVESVKKIINPTTPSYTTLTLVVIIVAIAVKLVLGMFVKGQGKALKSDALIASGADALFDAIVTLSTLISAGIMLIWNVNLDGIFGTIISLVIVKAGVEMLASPLGELLGTRISPEFAQQLKDKALSFDGVYGVYDIIVNNYGPNTLIGSLHISVAENATARELHLLTRSMSEAFYRDFGIIMTIGIYAVYTGDTPMARLQKAVVQASNDHPGVAQAHAFYYYAEKNLITIDLVPDESVKDIQAFADTMNQFLHEQFPEHKFFVVVDFNYS
ncbi:MAG: cation diffusion facilitator family transporter [Bacteroidales bacterium]|nr:cation diffusion facilitator family transporter [Bacteroidales bacterium]